MVNGLVKLKYDATLASGSVDEIIKIWNLTNGNLMKNLTGHINVVNELVLLRNGNLASCSVDSKNFIWDIKSGLKLKTLHGHRANVLCIALLNNEILASGSED
jgi:WD40 repeat protein